MSQGYVASGQPVAAYEHVPASSCSSSGSITSG